jgi:hypothetical protein
MTGYETMLEMLHLKVLNICIHIVAFTYQTVNLFFPKIADEQLTEKNPFSRRKIV